MQKLLIVESPPKCKTIRGYLGKDYEVIASYGHIRSLKKQIKAVAYDRDFDLEFKVSSEKTQRLKNIKAAIKKSSHVYIATDFDREGEAIGWGIIELCQEILADKVVQRITFTEITKQAIVKALENPRMLDDNLISAYKARTAVDFLLGFHLSPLLWSAVPKACSVGRVQSPSVKLIAQRDLEIKNFTPEEYWRIEGVYGDTTLELHTYQGVKVEQFSFTNEKVALDVRKKLLTEAQEISYDRTETRAKKINAPAPFITAQLQQVAAREFNFSLSYTMQIAQKLYEGVKLSSQIQPLITYMRTDSSQVSDTAVMQVKDYLKKKNLDFKPRTIKKKKKSDLSQEAHEAIRPVDIFVNPQEIKQYVDENVYRLYELIWRRTLQAYMPPAQYHTQKEYFYSSNRKHVFVNQITILKEYGWKALDQLQEHQSTKQHALDTHIKHQVTDVVIKQSYTKPPAKFNEASLVQKLESMQLGRPSTYAYILDTIKKRSYVFEEKKTLNTTTVGYNLVSFLDSQFADYVDYNFTSYLEKELDDIACGKVELLPVLRAFWNKLSDSIKNYLLCQGSKCQVCGQKKIPVIGSKGWYLKCSNACVVASFTQQEVLPGRSCQLCKSDMILRKNRFSGDKFAACSKYPKCKYNEPYDLGNKQRCTKCNIGWIIQRKSRKKPVSTFWACSAYPKCKFTQDVKEESKQDYQHR